MTYPTRKNLVVAISPTPYDKPLLVDMVPEDALFFLGVAVSGVALVGKGGAGGPYTFTTVAGTAATHGFEPAPGLTLNPDGSITGTPAAQGVFSFVAQVEDIASQTHDASFSINVQSGLIPVVFQPTIGENGVPYRFAFIVRDLTGTTVPSGYTVASGTLPNGLSLSGAVVSGTPTALAVGVTQATINVTYLGMSLDIPCTFTVADEVALTFTESIDPPNGWGGGAGSWLPSVTRGIPYIAHLEISGGVPPYSLSMSDVDPWPTGFSLSNQLRQIVGKTLDPASTTNPKLSAVLVTDALGAVALAQRAYFIIEQPNSRIQPRRNGVDASGGDGIVNLDFIEGANVSLDVNTDGYTTQVTIHAHPPSSSNTINGVSPDTAGNWQISGISIDSNGDLVIHSSTGGVLTVTGLVVANTDPINPVVEVDGGLALSIGRPGGAILSSGTYRVFLIPAKYASASSWEIACDQNATLSLDVWYHTFGSTWPTVSDSIVGGSYPSITAGRNNSGTTSGWTTTDFADGAYIAFQVRANDFATNILFKLKAKHSL